MGPRANNNPKDSVPVVSHEKLLLVGKSMGQEENRVKEKKGAATGD